MKKVLIILAALLMLLPVGCKNEQKYLNEDGVVKIGLITETMTVERWQRDRDIFVAKAKELGAEVIVKNAYEDAEVQIGIIREMINQGVDVIAVVAYDKDSLVDAVQFAHQNNVKVIAYDRLIKNANADLYITFDNFKVGQLIGQAVVQNVPKGDYLILNGSETDNNAFLFRDGYMSEIQPLIDNGSISVVGETWVDAWRDEVSYDFVSEIIAEGISFDAVVAANDRVAEGAVTALIENRLADDVYVTGQDAELAACQRIVEGLQDMTVYKPINVLAEGAAELAVQMALGQEMESAATINDGTYDIRYITYEPIGVTIDNIMETVIEDGFYTQDQVYVNLPQEMWPNK